MPEKINKNTPQTRGASVIEFIILFTVIIGSLIAFLRPSGLFQDSYNQVLSSVSSGMMNMAERVSLSIDNTEDADDEVITIASAGSGSGSSDGSGGSGGSSGGSGGGGGGSGGLGGFGGGGGGGSGGGDSGGFGGNTGSGAGTLGRGSGGSSGGGGDTTGSGNNTVPPPPQTFNSNIQNALNLLNGSTAGQYYYDLIMAKEISVIYDDFTKYDNIPNTVIAMWRGMANNTIYINQRLRFTAPLSAIASTIVHEASHADHDYNPERLIATTLNRHPELTRSDLSIYADEFGNEYQFTVYDPETDSTKVQVLLANSIDQEYLCFSNELEVWKELRGNDTNRHLDFDLWLYQQGEATYKANLRTRSSYVSLPEY